MNYDPLTAADERALIQRAQAGDTAAAQEVVTAYIPLALSLAAERRRRTGGSREDLDATAQLALCEALPKFDPSHEVRFGTYARRVIDTHLTDAVGEQMSVVHVPANARREGLNKALNPTAQAAFDRATAPAAEVDERDQTGNAELELFQLIHGRQTANTLREAVDTLEEREAYVVREAYLADPPRTLQDIGDELGLSRERVRQIRNDAFGRLRKRLRRLNG